MAKIKATTQPAPTQTADGGAVVDLGGTVAQTSANMPNHPGNDPFYLAVHPMRWMVLGGAVVPDLIQLTATPGANGCAMAGGRLDASGLISQAQASGRIVLTNTSEYLRRTVCTGGAYYHTRWERLIPGSSALMPDTAGDVAWRLSLIERGIAPRPSLAALTVLRERYATEFGRSKRQQDADAIAVIEAEIAKIDDGRAVIESEGVALG